MSNIDESLDGLSQIFAVQNAGDVYFTALDFTYSYGQVALDQKTSEQCNFLLVCCKNGNVSMGTYRFRRLLWAYFNAGGFSKSYRYPTRTIP